MPISDEFQRLPCALIKINHGDRQRKKVDTKDLKQSIEQYGVLQPIVVNRLPDNSLELVFGERRLTSCLELGLPDIPVRFLSDLSKVELKLLEFEENSKRADLHWRDQTAAVAEIHQLQQSSDPAWSVANTGQLIGFSPDWIRRILRVHADLDSPKLSGASDIQSAYNILSKADSRKADLALGDLIAGGAKLFVGAGGKIVAEGQEKGDGAQSPQDGAGQAPTDGPAPIPGDPANPYAANLRGPGTMPPNGTAPLTSPGQFAHNPNPTPPPESILSVSFLDWAPLYSGPKFNLIHCDFPYGVNVFDGTQGATGSRSSADLDPGGLELTKKQLYSDKEEVYWELIDCLCDNLDRLMAHAGHLLFWFSMKHYTRTLAHFQRHAPDLVFLPHPLIWFKSDNKGIISDAKRGPRNVYETCLFASRGDRLIVRPVANTYAAPTDKTYHRSTKPEPMLRHFFSMLVDDTTSLLDPTCGGGSALRAAESLGAKRVQGLEINPEHAQEARDALKKFRLLRQAG